KSDTAGLPNFGFSAAAAQAQPNATATTPANPAPAAVPIAGLAIAIAARAQAGSNQFNIRLDPPELGRIDVHLDVDRDGQVTTHMTADRADTLQLLQSQQPQLERALEQAGLKTADNGLQFTLRDQSFAGQNNGSNPQQNNGAQLVIPDPDLPPVGTTQIYSRIGRSSGVDIRV
ncbi:MAG: flagellar hook-length control protein FliK, partial [Hyphomicrobiales bacterium]|nr:flagellar hook-length control protein FliK [Hyphomicrobiales bacterium]